MLEAYASVGYDPGAFWSLTPRLYLIHMKAARARLVRERTDRLEAAWLVAALQRQNKLPPLASLISPPPKLTPRQVIARLDAMTAGLPKRTWSEWRNQ